MVEYKYNMYADLIYYVLTHIQIDNAANVYDEDYISDMENVLHKKLAVPDDMVQYYNKHFDRLAPINFLPILAGSREELFNMFHNIYGLTDEDRNAFIMPFCRLVEDVENRYLTYWREYDNELFDKKMETERYFNARIAEMKLFFDYFSSCAKMKINVSFSHSLRKNGRAFGQGNNLFVMLPFPDESHSKEASFFQLVHECTHSITDPLIREIRMDDGSHDIAEYQVILYDLWLFEQIDAKYARRYTEWISKEILDECDENLSEEHKKSLRQIIL